MLHTCEYLESRGFEVTYLDVDENGIVKLEELKRAIRPDTILISIMFANNEIGTIQPVKEIGKLPGRGACFFIRMQFRPSAIFLSVWMSFLLIC